MTLMSDHRRSPRATPLPTKVLGGHVEPSAAANRRIYARVEELPVEGPQTVRLVGELDLSVACSILRQICSALDRGNGLLIVDLASMALINSSGVLVLEGASRYALGQHRLISFINPQPMVRELLALHGSDQVIVDGAASGSYRDIPAVAG